MVVADLTYAYMQAPWDSPLSLGVQAFIEYNGYILNDRHQADRIRVTSITGLDDADISDSREVIPGDDGEFVYDSWNRGRTIVLTGEIQAGSLGTQKMLERDLKAAFAPLYESPMKFRWFDIYDSFDDVQTLQNYSSNGSSILASGPTNLVPNPSFEYDTVGSAPAAWIASGGPYWQSPGATLTAQTSAGAVAGSQAMRVITTSANNSQGAFLTLVGTYAAGVAYTATVYMRGSAGGEIVDFLFGNGGGADSANLQAITLTTAWQRFTLVWTPTTAETNPGLMVRTHGAVAQTFYADAAMVTQTSGAVNYFDGDTTGYAWSGARGDSSSSPLGQLLSVTGGVLRWDATTNALLMRSADNRLWADAQTTLRIVIPSNSATGSVVIVPALADSSNYVSVAFNGGSGSPTMTISSVIGGTSYQLATENITGLVAGQSIWLRAKKEGDLITAEVWLSAPVENATPDFYTTAWLTGSDADLLGDQVLTQIGFGATSAGWTLDDFRIESICPCDISFNVKKLSSLSIKDSQDSQTRFKRSFQITMRASQPNAPCATQSRSLTLIPSPSGTSQLGFSSPLTSPLEAQTFVPGTVNLQNNILSLCNRGTAPDRPILVVYGAISEFALVSLTNGMQLNWSGSLADGDYLVFDCLRRTLVNSVGANQMKYLSFTDSRWMVLEPQWNDLYITGSNYSDNTKLFAFSHGRWK